MDINQFRLLILLWNIGIVDTFSVFKLCLNFSVQYGTIVAASSVGNVSELQVQSLIEPVLGLKTAYQFIKTAGTAAERSQRIATVAAFLSASGASLTADPSTNGAMGALVTANINYIKLTMRGGSSFQLQKNLLTPSLKDFAIVVDSVKIPSSSIHPCRTQFIENSRIVIDNVFQKHMARRYSQLSGQKIQTVSTGYLVPIVSTQISNAALIGWAFFGVGLISFVTLGADHYLK
jgi:hypothetical protein